MTPPAAGIERVGRDGGQNLRVSCRNHRSVCDCQSLERLLTENCRGVRPIAFSDLNMLKSRRFGVIPVHGPELWDALAFLRALTWIPTKTSFWGQLYDLKRKITLGNTRGGSNSNCAPYNVLNSPFRRY